MAYGGNTGIAPLIAVVGGQLSASDYGGLTSVKQPTVYIVGATDPGYMF
jgi:hypothetical protein